MSFLQKLAQRTKEVAEKTAQAAAAKMEDLKVNEAVREERYALCKACPHMISATSTCTKCGCFMAAKTYLATAECPIGNWQKITITTKKEQE